MCLSNLDDLTLKYWQGRQAPLKHKFNKHLPSRKMWNGGGKDVEKGVITVIQDGLL